MGVPWESLLETRMIMEREEAESHVKQERVRKRRQQPRWDLVREAEI